nr:hypothetical protein [Tanacetum cinerariifolium]
MLRLTAPTSRFKIKESSVAATTARQPGSYVVRRANYGFVDIVDASIRAAEERAMTAVRVVNLRVSYQADVRIRESEEFYTRHQDAQDDHVAVRAETKVLRREMLAYEKERVVRTIRPWLGLRLITEHRRYELLLWRLRCIACSGSEAFEEEDDDDEEEEEHLALADSFVVPTINLVPPGEDTEAFETNESAPTLAPPRSHKARISVRHPLPMTASMEARNAG